MFFSGVNPGPDMVHISVPDAGVIALLGYGVVFLGLIMLILVVVTVSKFFTTKAKKPEPAPAAAVQVPVAPAAPGAAGELKLYSVEPKTAAMLMAIVANKMDKPLNELRFISIREVE